jgi:hypothetical protein
MFDHRNGAGNDTRNDTAIIWQKVKPPQSLDFAGV